MTQLTTYTYDLTREQQVKVLEIMDSGNYRPREVPYSLRAVEGDGFTATLYSRERHNTRKFCVQGSKAQDFILFQLEPLVLGGASLGYETVLDKSLTAPHGGSDESGKGDYFGPLCVCCAYVDERLYDRMKEMGVKDCKQMTDKAVLAAGASLRALLGPEGYSVVKLGPAAYNRLYAKMRNINRMLAWAHATAIEELLTKRPGCPRVVIDQFAPTEATILRQLKPLGRAAKIEQRHKAESDMAVAAASVIAREAFLRDVVRMGEEMFGPENAKLDSPRRVPIGSSDPRVAALAVEMVKANGPVWLMNHCKAHFQTTDKVLAACGATRADLPPEGQVESVKLKSS